jgi:hypothetical protein
MASSIVAAAQDFAGIEVVSGSLARDVNATPGDAPSGLVHWSMTARTPIVLNAAAAISSIGAAQSFL